MKEVFQALKARLVNGLRRNQDLSKGVEDYEGVDDWETRDKYVRSLRRQVRRIQDEEEKKQLQAIVDKREKARTESIFSGDHILNYNTPIISKSKNKNTGAINFIGGAKKKNGRYK